MIADVDKDGSGAIDFDEFVYMMTAKIGERDSKEELMKAFQVIDQDKNVNLKIANFYLGLYCPLLLMSTFFIFSGGRGKSLLQTFSVLLRSWEKVLLSEIFRRWLRKLIVIVSVLPI